VVAAATEKTVVAFISQRPLFGAYIAISGKRDMRRIRRQSVINEADGDFCGLIESADLSAMKPERNNLKRRGK